LPYKVNHRFLYRKFRFVRTNRGMEWMLYLLCCIFH